MDKIISFIVAILLSHQIVTIVTYIQLRREDRGISTRRFPKFMISFFELLYFLPMIGDFFYTITIGLVDHLREKRLCEMLVNRDDDIKRLKDKNASLERELSIRKAYEDHLYEICSSDWFTKDMPKPSLYDFMKYNFFEDY